MRTAAVGLLWVVACTSSTRSTATPALVGRGSASTVASQDRPGHGAPIDLADYGADPDYRPPTPPPVKISVDQRVVLDEIERIARVFAREPSHAAVLSQLGTPTGAPSSWGDQALDPISPGLAVIHARLNRFGEHLELRFFDPVPIEALMTRFGAFSDYMIDDREDPGYTTENLDVPGAYDVRIEITSHARSMQDLPKDRVRVVVISRYTRSD